MAASSSDFKRTNVLSADSDSSFTRYPATRPSRPIYSVRHNALVMLPRPKRYNSVATEVPNTRSVSVDGGAPITKFRTLPLIPHSFSSDTNNNEQDNDLDIEERSNNSQHSASFSDLAEIAAAAVRANSTHQLSKGPLQPRPIRVSTCPIDKDKDRDKTPSSSSSTNQLIDIGSDTGTQFSKFQMRLSLSPDFESSNNTMYDRSRSRSNTPNSPSRRKTAFVQSPSSSSSSSSAPGSPRVKNHITRRNSRTGLVIEHQNISLQSSSSASLKRRHSSDRMRTFHRSLSTKSVTSSSDKQLDSSVTTGTSAEKVCDNNTTTTAEEAVVKNDVKEVMHQNLAYSDDFSRSVTKSNDDSCSDNNHKPPVMKFNTNKLSPGPISPVSSSTSTSRTSISTPTRKWTIRTPRQTKSKKSSSSSSSSPQPIPQNIWQKVTSAVATRKAGVFNVRASAPCTLAVLHDTMHEYYDGCLVNRRHNEIKCLVQMPRSGSKVQVLVLAVVEQRDDFTRLWIRKVQGEGSVKVSNDEFDWFCSELNDRLEKVIELSRPFYT